MVLHILDRKEIELPYDHMVTFQDLETNEKIQIDPSELRETYKAEVAKFLELARKACTDSDVEYHEMFTDVPVDKALVRLMSRRS